jgi:hypothetical protein
VIEHSIPVQPEAQLLRLSGQSEQVFFTPPLGPHATLLVEFTQVIKVIDIVAIAFLTAGFAAWWEPHVVYAASLEIRKRVVEALVMLSVRWTVPLEPL